MAKVIWADSALTILFEYIENARLEYGDATVKRWQKERKEMEWRLERYPTSYTPEALLFDRKICYRGCLIMNRRFKTIYYYDEAEDIVHIIDIWDTHMNPSALVNRIN